MIYIIAVHTIRKNRLFFLRGVIVFVVTKIPLYCLDLQLRLHDAFVNNREVIHFAEMMKQQHSSHDSKKGSYKTVTRHLHLPLHSLLEF